MLCDLITCYSIERALFQRLKMTSDEPLSRFAFKFNLRHYSEAGAGHLEWSNSTTVILRRQGISMTFGIRDL